MSFNIAHPTKDTYEEQNIIRLKAMIDKNGKLSEGDTCPTCGESFVRELLYIVYDPASKVIAGTDLYLLICTGCHIKVKDIWETKEVWEITEAIPE